MKWIKYLSGLRLRRVKRLRGAPQDEIMLKEIDFRDNTLQMTMQHPEFATLTDGLVKFFKDAGGVNYVSVSAYHPDLGLFDVTIQRQHGKSIAQINAELRKENEELKEKLSRAFA